MALATADDLRVLLRLPALDAAQTALAELLLDLATGAVQAEAGQPLEESEDTVTVDGTGTAKLVLPRWPVTAVDQVIEIDRDGVETALTEPDDYHWSAAGILVRRRGCWPAHPKAVRVTPTAGYAVIPDDLRNVVLRTARRGWDNPAGVSMERLGDWQASYTAAGVELSESDLRIISRYRART